jgi:hypothetical protein
MKKLLPILFLLLGIKLTAQIIPHQYLVKYTSPLDFSIHLRSSSKETILVKELAGNYNVALIEFPASYTKDQEIQLLKNHSSISAYQCNHILSQRTCRPNDPEFSQQWNFSKMGFEDVWCYENGGISPLGDTLVIGVIDNGFDYGLTELKPNLFVNHKEIPDNKLDDDGNGYVDDYYGYNSVSFNGGDNHPLNNHGTNILSLVGALGDNGIGITGANQHIKMLLCSASNDAHLVECYTYFHKMKDQYLKSNGKSGAYIVASTISLGYDNAFPDEFPLICPLYDYLGEVGIMNVCATVNKSDHDVSIKGDVPSLCPSLFLITVTNTDINDKKVDAAGFSKIHIDIGASGENIPVLEAGGSTGYSAGCSLSAPQVGGGIALLNQYCETYANLVKASPKEGLFLMRDFVLNCGDLNESLQDITSSGRRFNVQKSLICLEKFCNTLVENEFIDIRPNPVIGDELNIVLGFERFAKYNLEIVNPLGQRIWHQELNYHPGVNNRQSINISNCNTGVYYVFVKSEHGSLSKAFIKK